MVDIVYAGGIVGAIVLTGVGYILKDALINLMLNKLNEAKLFIEAHEDIAPELKSQLEQVKVMIETVDMAFADGRVTTSEVFIMARQAVKSYKSFKALYARMKG